MGDRQCGYCREYNHNQSVCRVRLSQIEAVRRHVGGERLRQVQLLIASGYGSGAIVEAYDYHSGDYVNCIISDPNECIHSYFGNYLEYRNVKYKKTVRTILKSASGYYPETPNGCDDLIRYQHVAYININVMPLHDMSRNITASICITTLDRSLLHPTLKDYNRPLYSWDRPSKLLSPSNDGQPDMGRVLRDFQSHDRLDKKVHGWKPIA